MALLRFKQTYLRAGFTLDDSKLTDHLCVVLGGLSLPVPHAFVVGPFWRYRYDKFGWTMRSSQLYENKLLRIGSPHSHFGILAVFLGHVMGLGVPKSWTEAVRVSEAMYHFMAVSIGAVAGFATVVGMAILIYRRRTTGPVFSATTKMDKAMYLVLATVVLLGLANGDRQHRSLRLPRRGLGLAPRDLPLPDLSRADGRGAARVPAARAGGQVLVRAVAVHPVGARVQRSAGLLTRPYIVYLSRDDTQLGSHTPRRGWDRVSK